MKNILEFVKESLIKKGTKRVDDEDYYNDPPMTKSEAIRKLDKTGRIYWEAQQKMDAWHEGKRNENIKACSDAKLIMFYEICSNKKYRDELEAIENEAQRRGWTFKKIK